MHQPAITLTLSPQERARVRGEAVGRLQLFGFPLSRPSAPSLARHFFVGIVDQSDRHRAWGAVGHDEAHAQIGVVHAVGQRVRRDALRRGAAHQRIGVMNQRNSRSGGMRRRPRGEWLGRGRRSSSAAPRIEPSRDGQSHLFVLVLRHGHEIGAFQPQRAGYADRAILVAAHVADTRGKAGFSAAMARTSGSRSASAARSGRAGVFGRQRAHFEIEMVDIGAGSFGVFRKKGVDAPRRAVAHANAPEHAAAAGPQFLVRAILTGKFAAGPIVRRFPSSDKVIASPDRETG